MSRVWSTQGVEMRVYDTSGALVFGAPEVAPEPPSPITPPTGPARNIASWCNGINLGKSVANRDSTTVTTSHVLAVDVVDPVFEWVQTAGFVGQDNGAAFTVTASVNGGAPVPVTVGGAAAWRLEKPSGLRVITSDPVKVQARAGDTLTVTVTADADGTSGSIPSSFTGAVQGRDAGPLFGGWALRPSRVVAPSDVPAWVAVGDSICQQDNSFPQRALGLRGLPFTVGAQGGDAYIYHAGTLGDRQAAHLTHASRVLDEMGTNDAGHTGSTHETDRENARRTWLQYRAKGVDVIVKTTITPAPSTSNGWADLEGQSVDNVYSTGRIPYNAWLRDGAPLTADKTAALPAGTTDAGAIRCDVIQADGSIKKGAGGHPVTAISDCVRAVEEGDTGKYNAPAREAMKGWSDGLHPSPGVHAILGERLARDLEILGF